MRMLPVVFYVNSRVVSFDKIFLAYDKILKVPDEVSSLTHSHPISLIACEMYVLIGVNLLKGVNLKQSIEMSYEFLKRYHRDNKWFKKFERIPKLSTLTREEISSSGYICSLSLAKNNFSGGKKNSSMPKSSTSTKNNNAKSVNEVKTGSGKPKLIKYDLNSGQEVK